MLSDAELAFRIAAHFISTRLARQAVPKKGPVSPEGRMYIKAAEVAIAYAEERC